MSLRRPLRRASTINGSRIWCSRNAGVSDDTLRILEARGFIIPKNADGSFQHRVLGRANSIMKVNGYYLGAADTRDADGAAVGY